MSARTARSAPSPSNDPLDEPPPYTVRPDPCQGEETLEYGPSRPFQPPPVPPSHPPLHSQPPPPPRPPAPPQPPQSSFHSVQTAPFLTPQLTRSLPRPIGRGGSLWQQLSDQIEQIATQVERQATGLSNRTRIAPPPIGASWPSYPGQSTASRSAHSLPLAPPQHHIHQPLHRSASSSASLPAGPSDFTRDFYAAGTGDGVSSASGGDRGSQAQGDRSPTTTPVPGRPLLYEGKLLVYPRGHICEKCQNTGYKYYDPLLPCKKCWSKYGKSFSGPLVYSYSSSSPMSNTQNTNLQKPLPYHVPSAPAPPPLPPRSILPTSPQGGYHARGPGITTLHPHPSTVFYRPGDPRIGGSLCWRCNGKGTMNIIIDTINCPICDGSGRTFY